MNSMDSRDLKGWSGVGFIAMTILCTVVLAMAFGCADEESTNTECADFADGQVIYEDGFDGDTLDEASWTSIEEASSPYSTTGSGELQIAGEEEGGGATFVNNGISPGSCYGVSVGFRTTQNDPVEDNVDMMLLLNFDMATEEGYYLVLTSDPDGESRDYTMSIYRMEDDDATELVTEYAGGPTPQINADDTFTLEGGYCNGCIVFRLSDSDGDIGKTITYYDPSITDGSVGFHGDMNIGGGSSSDSQALFFDYFSVYN